MSETPSQIMLNVIFSAYLDYTFGFCGPEDLIEVLEEQHDAYKFAKEMATA